MNQRSCGKCEFWCLRNPGTGECRRHTPAAIACESWQAVKTAWPATNSDAWCGEFQEPAKPAAMEQPERSFTQKMP